MVQERCLNFYRCAVETKKKLPVLALYSLVKEDQKQCFDVLTHPSTIGA